jgi:hypothetical protein
MFCKNQQRLALRVIAEQRCPEFRCKIARAFAAITNERPKHHEKATLEDVVFRQNSPDLQRVRSQKFVLNWRPISRSPGTVWSWYGLSLCHGMVGPMAATQDDQYSPDETARRRDAVLKIMVNTPPQPRTTRPPIRGGKQKPTGAGRKPKAAGRQQKP